MSFFRNRSQADETIQSFTATSNQTVFNLTGEYEVGKNRIEVIVGGVRQFSPTNFTETSPKSFTLKIGVPLGTDVVAIYQ